MRRIALVLMLLAVTGCAENVAKGIKVGILTDSAFSAITLKDVQQAKLFAESGNDPLALKCWVYLEEFIIENAPSESPLVGKAVGVFSIYQKVRNARRNVIEVEISDQFRMECGPMLIDSMGVLSRLGIKLAF